MRFLRKIAGFLGFSKDELHDSKEEEDDNLNHNNNNNNNLDDIRRNRLNVEPIHTGPRKGFSVAVQVPVERPSVGPILVPCNGDGGIQGLNWYKERLRIDEDGDVADEFIHEVSQERSHVMQDQSRELPRFQVKSNVRPVIVRKQQVTPEGKFQHLVDFHGRSQWV